MASEERRKNIHDDLDDLIADDNETTKKGRNFGD